MHAVKALVPSNAAACDCGSKYENNENHKNCVNCDSRIRIKKDSKKSVRSVNSNPIAQTMPFVSHAKVHEITCPICGACSEGASDASKLKSILKEMDSFTMNPLASTLRRSFSLCSLACRKLKKGLNTPNFLVKKNTNWFLTKQPDQNCHQIFEIHKTSESGSQSSREHLRKKLAMILVVTPSGVVVPFEPVKDHF